MSKNIDKPTGAASRPSNADYPVEPAERINQEARLRKAAAAGASSLKSPIPSLMSQLPSSHVAPQGAPEPPPVVSIPGAVTERAANSDVAPIPDIPDDRRTPLIDGNQEILAELSKISAWADLQRKITKWSLIFVGVFIPVAIGTGILMEQQLKTNLESNVSPRQADWYDVEHNVRLGDFEKAIAIGEELIRKTPQYSEAHQRLAGAYLASGNLEKAKEHYAEAFRLFPSEENEKLLDAIEKRINGDKP